MRAILCWIVGALLAGPAVGGEYVVHTIPVGPFTYLPDLWWIDNERVVFSSALREANGEIVNGVWIVRLRPSAAGGVGIRKVTSVFDSACFDTARGAGYIWNWDEMREFTVDGLALKLGKALDRKTTSFESTTRLGCRLYEKGPSDGTNRLPDRLLDGHGYLFVGRGDGTTRVSILTPAGRMIDLKGVDGTNFASNYLSWSKLSGSYYNWDYSQARSPKLRVRRWDEKTRTWIESYDNWKGGGCRSFWQFTPQGETTIVCMPFLENGQDVRLALGAIYQSALFDKGRQGRIVALRKQHKTYEPVIDDCMSDKGLHVSPDERVIVYLSGARTQPTAVGAPCANDTLALKVIERLPAR